jgi:hypothetical protein
MEFHISRAVREKLDVDDLLFSYTGNVVFANVAASRRLAQQLNNARGSDTPGVVNAGALFAMGLIDELNHAMVARYRKEIDPSVLTEAVRWFATQSRSSDLEKLLLSFTHQFPNVAVYRGELTAAEWLQGTSDGLPNREAALEELMLLWLANINPAFAPFRELFEDSGLKRDTIYPAVTTTLPDYFTTRPLVSPEIGTLLDALRAPFLASPDSLTGQLDFIREHWAKYLGEDLRRVILAIDVIREEDLAIWMRFHPPGPDRHRHGPPGRGNEGFIGDEFVGFDQDFNSQDLILGPDGVRRPRYAAGYQAPLNEYEAFSADQAWMPNVVLMAKSTYVWLEQLSKKYQRHIHRLDQIPTEELKLLTDRGITSLWLIGLWERSTASKTIKRLRGHTDAVASAYSLKDYRIADDLGGDAAYDVLRRQCAALGIRLASDMVPNHMGIDSDWVIEHPDWFLFRWESPFPVYQFEGPDLSTDSRVEIKIEDHYYEQTDAAVVFRLRHHREGTTRFVYHGNDGTTFAWNDTAQLDYSKAYVREYVIQTILHVARLFPIIRFDAAMVLAKRHVQRLWFPLPGAGGSIPSRAENAISQEEFDALMPHEFWREVVDRVAVEVPGTLLLAEAFWLLEGYFVRTLGMHRVYNSAFMNMLRDEENAKYRSYLKKTIEFDPDILKRYVNFMSNPDERTAIDQFGSGDKYFGVCTLLATLPGLPMFAHGQIEGYTERYGMEFKQARLNEYPDDDLTARHQREIAPLLHNRQLFAESANFVLYDLWTGDGRVDENVYAYSNRLNDQRGVIVYNNSYASTRGTLHLSAASMDKATGSLRQKSLVEGLGLPTDDSVILAYRNAASGLEYLRRVTDISREGLTLDLRGYQYVVLLNWRELRSTAEQPWDQLCNALNGAGVHSVEESLSKLRLQPLHESLRQSISASNIHAFVEVARQAAAENAGGSSKKLSAATAKGEKAEPLKPSSTKAESTKETAISPAPESQQPSLDSRLGVFLERTQPFFDIAIESFPTTAKASTEDLPIEPSPESSPTPLPVTPPLNEAPSLAQPVPHPGDEGSSPEALKTKAIAAVRLSSLGRVSSTELKAAFQHLSPHAESHSQQEHAWSAVLSWVVLSSLPWPDDSTASAALFDKLQLRSALADTFLSLGIGNEAAWRKAAQIRFLLLHGGASSAAAMRSQTLWNDPDIRWLAGVHEYLGKTYANKELFQEVAAWLQLPTLIEILQQRSDASGFKEVETTLKETYEAMQRSGYNLQTYLSSPEDTPEESKKLDTLGSPPPPEPTLQK